MPYGIMKDHPKCPTGNWAVVKERKELFACHDTKQQAINQMIALSLAEGLEPLGEVK